MWMSGYGLSHHCHHFHLYNFLLSFSEHYEDLYDDVSGWKVVYVPGEDRNCRGIIGMPSQLWWGLHKSGVIVNGTLKGTTTHLAYKKGKPLQ